ncbi:hypothetical protein [Bacillus thuringiensis]|uniref:hypothetical protein n=1 Tax=Bacillus thuringiensis TaxID=1428 RepID=UPI000BF25216|nr:hypothetical protein [Bacillus thuringiensis]PES54350.1 hypothetical protein CN506_19945 [Bacillus thuringiensis]
MNPLIKEYIERIKFEEVDGLSLTVKQLEELEIEHGFVCATGTTDLWICRSLSVIDVLGAPTVMESQTQYTILDSFGAVLWTDETQGIIEYVTGFIK